MKISNLKFKISNVRGGGFTLVELLVVSGIFIIITTTIVSILFIILRGTKKSDSIIIVRQNGEQAMAQMVRIMRFAKSLDDPCPLTDPKSVTITAADLAQTVYTFTCPSAPAPTPNFIDLNSTKLTNDATVVVDNCSFVCTQQSGSSPTIGISFTLSKKNLSGLPEENSTIPFKSSVTLRNIGGQ
jgi:type II secretory pathway pseudopilin PulG